MIRASEETVVESRPVIYAGRFTDSLSGLDPLDGCTILDDWQVLPTQLAAPMSRATTLVVLDMFSFPFEAMTPEQWDVPMILIPPAEFDAGFLDAVFGEVAFGRLGFFDRVATGDSALWEHLRIRYGYAAGQRIEVEGDSLNDTAAEIRNFLSAELSTTTHFGDGEYEAERYWKERGDALASSVPHRAICSVHHGPEFNKAMHRAQAAALEPQFAAARGNRVESTPFDVLEIGAGVGRWAQSFDLAKTRFAGVDISGGMVEAARANFPEARFDHLDNELNLPYEDESFDLVFSVTVIHHNPTPSKRKLLSEMWRATRPGGRLLFLEDFVSGRQSEKSTVYPMSVLKFVDLLLDATGGQVLLEHVESLRYPHDTMVRGGVLALTRLGVPKRW